jgi:glycosyltransferase involved in cell wall biosynthesis
MEQRPVLRRTLGVKDRPIRIAHLGKFYPPAPGGIEAMVQTLARAQAAQGCDVRVICVNHAGKTESVSSAAKGARSRTVKETDGAVRVTRLGRRWSLGGLDICPELRGTINALQSSGPDGVDVLHLHTPNPTMMIPLAFARWRIPAVITHHSDIIKQKIRKIALAPLESRVYQSAACIMATSDRYIAGSSLLQRNKPRVTAVPLGIDLEPFLNPTAAILASAERWRAAYPGPLWLAVGRLVYYKGLDTAIRALANVPGKLLVIGSGPLRSELEALAASVGVADRVIWHGHATPDDLAGAYRAARAFWFPSNAKSEAFGLVQVEAMASGCPVINADIPGSGVAWVSPDGVSGFTVPVNDPSAFAAAARKLADDHALHARFAAGGQQRARDEFAAHVMAERTIAIYRSLHTAPGMPSPTGAA